MKAMSMLLGYALMASAMERSMYEPDVVGTKPYKKAPLTAKQKSKRNKAKAARKSRKK